MDEYSITPLGEFINNTINLLKPYLGHLTENLLVNSIAIIITFYTILSKITKYTRKYWYKNIYVLIPKETQYNKEHLSNQIDGFKYFLNEKTNNKLRKRIKFIVVNGNEEIKEVVKKIESKYTRSIILTTMSHIFDETLKCLTENRHEINPKIKLIGTLGSQSQTLKTINYPESILRIFPPDYDEAKVAYDFFHSKALSYFCSNSKCTNSPMLKNNKKQSKIIIFHKESYGKAICREFFEYDRIEKNNGKNSILPYGSLNTSDFIDLINIELDVLALNLKNDIDFYFIYLVGYEPSISKMIKLIFDEMKKKDININKICFLLPPTICVREWKDNICSTIKKLNDEFNIDKSKWYYMHPIIIKNDTRFIYNEKENNSLNFYYYDFKELKEYKNIKSKNFDNQRNYINIFAYLGLKVTKRIFDNWDSSFYAIKKNVLEEFSEERFIIYHNGDYGNNFTIRPFICEDKN